MRAISFRKLRDFWVVQKERKDSLVAERELKKWFKLVKRCGEPRSFVELKETFPSADQVGNCTVFDVANNRFRLIGRINYRLQIIYVLTVLSHADYDKDAWKRSCGCYRPPPKKAAQKPLPKKKGSP